MEHERFHAAYGGARHAGGCGPQELEHFAHARPVRLGVGFLQGLAHGPGVVGARPRPQEAVRAHRLHLLLRQARLLCGLWSLSWCRGVGLFLPPTPPACPEQPPGLRRAPLLLSVVDREALPEPPRGLAAFHEVLELVDGPVLPEVPGVRAAVLPGAQHAQGHLRVLASSRRRHVELQVRLEVHDAPLLAPVHALRRVEVNLRGVTHEGVRGQRLPELSIVALDVQAARVELHGRGLLPALGVLLVRSILADILRKLHAREAVQVQALEEARGHSARQLPEQVPRLQGAERVGHGRGDVGLAQHGRHRGSLSVGDLGHDFVQQGGDARVHGLASAVLGDVLGHVVRHTLGRQHRLAVRVRPQPDRQAREVAVHVGAVPWQAQPVEPWAPRVFENRCVPGAHPCLLEVLATVVESPALRVLGVGLELRARLPLLRPPSHAPRPRAAAHTRAQGWPHELPSPPPLLLACLRPRHGAEQCAMVSRGVHADTEAALAEAEARGVAGALARLQEDTVEAP